MLGDVLINGKIVENVNKRKKWWEVLNGENWFGSHIDLLPI